MGNEQRNEQKQNTNQDMLQEKGLKFSTLEGSFELFDPLQDNVVVGIDSHISHCAEKVQRLSSTALSWLSVIIQIAYSREWRCRKENCRSVRERII